MVFGRNRLRALVAPTTPAALFVFLLLLAGHSFAGNVTLAWDAVPNAGVTGYKVHHGPAAGSYTTSINVGNTTSYTIANLTDGATYHFAVTSYNAAGKQSSFSNDVVGKPGAVKPVADFSASTTSGPAPLAMNFINGSTGVITTYAWTFGDGGTSTVPNPSHVYSAAGVYTVGLTITGPGGSSTKTRANFITVTGASDTSPPTTPASLTATASGTGTVHLAWTASTDNVGVYGYKVERCEGATCTNFVQIATPTGTTYGSTSLKMGTTYRYRVRATDVVGNLSGYSPVATLVVNNLPAGARKRRDYDGNGQSDIVWRNGTSGSIAMWLMNGLSPASSAVLLNDPAWKVTHTGDLSGDGKTDLLWRSSGGATRAWLMNGTAVASSTTLLTDRNWTVVRVADFNGDSKADILWRNTATGQTAIWLMNGLSVASGTNILSDPNWQVVHLGDFNGDGKADLVWRNASTGQTALWLMNGAALASGRVILSDPTWQVSKVGDFNGDGKSDLLWRNTATGYTAIWLMNGLAPTGSATILTDPTWQATHVGDFDGNGKSDIVWRNNVSGYTAIWLMNGTAVATGNGIHTDPNWSVTHVSDANGDGKSDLLWRNTATGMTAAWLMNGTASSAGSAILADPSWSVGPPDGL